MFATEERAERDARERARARAGARLGRLRATTTGHRVAVGLRRLAAALERAHQPDRGAIDRRVWSPSTFPTRSRWRGKLDAAGARWSTSAAAAACPRSRSRCSARSSDGRARASRSRRRPRSCGPRSASSALGDRVSVRVARGEAVARPWPRTGAAFDVAISRATLAPEKWLALGARLVRPGGRVFALDHRRRAPRAPRPRALLRRPPRPHRGRRHVRLFHVEQSAARNVTVRSFSAMLEAELAALAAIDRRRACPEVAGRLARPSRCRRQAHALVLLQRLPRPCFPPCPRSRGRRRPPRATVSAPRRPAWSAGDLPAHRALEAALAALPRPPRRPASSRPATRPTSAS